MASNNTTEQEIIALFPDNTTHEISAADMRAYVNAIFSDKEAEIVKIDRLINLSANNTNIYEGSLVTIWNDGEEFNGLYVSIVNQPTIPDELIKVSGVATGTGEVNPIMTYDCIITNNTTITSDVYAEVSRLTTPFRDPGLYELKSSMIYSYDTTNRSAFFRFTTDGGVNWIEIANEPKDSTNLIPQTYFTCDDFAGGVKEMIVEARSEIAGDTLFIQNMTLAYQRVNG